MNRNAAPLPLIISTQEFSQQYLSSLETVAERLHRDMPEFAGMTAFGSTVRGEAGPGSDVDIAVFLEPSDAEDSVQNFHLPKEYRIRDNPYASRHEFHGRIELDYVEKVVELLDEEGLTKADIEILPISADIIDHAARTLLDKARKHEGPIGSSIPIVPTNIRFLFHAPIDDDRLQPYIGRTLEGLQKSPYGDKAWDMIRRTVAKFEQGRNGDYEANPHRYIPPTLIDAVRFYESAWADEEAATQP